MKSVTTLLLLNTFNIIILALISLFVSSNLIAQSGVNSVSSELEYVHTNFTTLDGLPSNEIYCVFKDSRGYIWIGTDRGLTLYDGYTFTTYTTEDGLTDNLIFGIAEDSKNNIWFTTYNTKICYYHPDRGFMEATFNSEIESSFKDSGRSKSHFFDQIRITENDTMYLSYYKYGYLKIALDNQEIIENNLIGIGNGGDSALLKLSNKPNYQNIYIHNGHVILNNPNIKVQLNNQSLPALDIKIDWFLDDRPYCIDSTSFYFLRNIFTMIKNDTIKQNYIGSRLHIHNMGEFFLINELDDFKEKGYLYISKSIKDKSHWKKLLNTKVRLTSSSWEKNGGIWISTIEHGLFHIPDFNNRTIKQNYNTKIMLPYKNGILLSERNGLYYFYENRENFYKLNEHLFLDSIVNTDGHFISLSHPLNFASYTQWNTLMSQSQLLVREVAVYGDKTFIVSNSGIYQYHSNEYLNPLLEERKTVYSVECIDSLSFVLGMKEGLFILKDKKLTPYCVDGTDFKYKAKDIKLFKEANILAVATIGNGLFLFKDRKFYRKLTIDNGLVSNTINQLSLDKYEGLWVATNKGINCITVVNDNFKIKNVFASSKNLLSPNVQQVTLFKDSLLLVGTDKGINEININALERRRTHHIPVFVTDISVNDTLVFKNSLEYNENNIVFHYTALEYNVHGNIEYRYRLKGLSDKWIYTKERKATFFNLNPDYYTFELEVKNSFGEWIKYQKAYEFTIDKPYWEKWWFRGGYMFIGFLIIGGALYYYISNLRKEKALIEDKQVLSEELNESRQKALSSQLNPHFVFNSLNSIQNFILTKRRELSSDYLSMFSKLMRFVFENSKKLYVSLPDEIEALRLYLELEQVRHNHKFKYELIYDINEISQVYMPSLLIQPMIENAIWHGLLHKQSEDRLLMISFKKEELYLKIEVKDNGVGRGGSKPRPKLIQKQKSSGVELTKQRLHLLSQSTGLDTNFEIIDLFDESGNQAGTQVMISIPLNLS